MRRKSFADMRCALAGALAQVGEWWSLLIVRDAALGLERFDEFQRSLGIVPTTLTSGATAGNRMAPQAHRSSSAAATATRPQRSP